VLANVSSSVRSFKDKLSGSFGSAAKRQKRQAPAHKGRSKNHSRFPNLKRQHLKPEK